MEPFEITCPHCQQRLRVTVPGLIGRKVKCPGCGERTRVEQPVDSDAHEAELAGAGSGVAKGEKAEKRGGAKVSRPSANDNASPGAPPESLLRALPQKEAYHESGVWGRKNEDSASQESDLSSNGSGTDGSDAGDSNVSSSAPRRKTGNAMAMDRKTILLYTGISVGATVFLAFIILVSKGYFFNNDKRLKRQDSSAFANLGREVEKQNLWKAEPPTAAASALRANINKLLAAAKGRPGLRAQVESVQTSFQAASAAHAKSQDHSKFSKQIAGMQAQLSDVSDALEDLGLLPKSANRAD